MEVCAADLSLVSSVLGKPPAMSFGAFLGGSCEGGMMRKSSPLGPRSEHLVRTPTSRTLQEHGLSQRRRATVVASSMMAFFFAPTMPIWSALASYVSER